LTKLKWSLGNGGLATLQIRFASSMNGAPNRGFACTASFIFCSFPLVSACLLGLPPVQPVLLQLGSSFPFLSFVTLWMLFGMSYANSSLLIKF
jgi:hypothetical protein